MEADEVTSRGQEPNKVHRVFERCTLGRINASPRRVCTVLAILVPPANAEILRG